jgi:hypothetical protein
MPSRRFQRPLTSIALIIAAVTCIGCASTNRFLVDPLATSRLTIEAITFGDQQSIKFGAAGGSYDPEHGVIRGSDTEGKSIEIALAKVYRVTFRPEASGHRDLVAGNPKPLLDGDAWKADGRAQFVVKTSGEILDLRKVQSRVDTTARLVAYTPESGEAVYIPFSDITYLQIRDSHPGRTALCIFGIVCEGFAIGIAVSGGVAPDW